MGKILDFFTFLLRVFKGVLSFIVSIPGMFFSACVSIVTFVSSLVDNVGNITTTIVRFFDTCSDKIQEFSNWLQSVELLSLFYHIFALDVLFQNLTTFFTIYFFMFSLIVDGIILNLVFIFIPWILYKLVAKIIQAISLGFAKTA